ncbi:MAG: phosphoribosylglycinamide formyltransferase [Candidatus Tectomicrobia bacterium RIFCSPLOWO2_12_FULL_69_37]|nr:MAG: phosphoribosylglycinamide formyltransferase [Candidatus Tectomicrobia bacterium RIFCSPLOWO2_02_FULL_70_19]OGL65918.1 MAG: phosphoribosylglycinamide formyltransferase [Candidatus Tectomicrobia bacterium RIFCSPLOWO2_12_FULL_69_37]
MSPRRLRLAVLASGRGTNLQALLDAGQDPDYPAEVALVLSDRADAPALRRAREAGAEAEWIDPAPGGLFERIGGRIEGAGAGLVCCAGFMRILPPEFVRRFAGRILNIHPSLLPSFPGLHAQRKAVRAGVRVAGCTVHFIDEGVDTGPVVLQAAVPVLPGDDEEALSGRILRYEHRIYPLAVRLIAEGRVRLEGRKVLIEGTGGEGQGFISPPLAGLPGGGEGR